MSKTQAEHHFVDRAGSVQVTPAARCDLSAKATDVDTTVVPVPTFVERKRSRLLIRHHAGESSTVLYLGGEGVSTATGYPIAIGDTIALPVSPGIRVMALRSATGIDPSDVRTLELG